ncbi:hypothetical protein RDV64_13190 [Acuticoccus sp. MNP-M23]|uniref:hypothetical protein n=1 Tax=Acuticoccus sp. MNP-M23 TaxID=3072793 RepID=UPI002814CFCF|nr:hypothetical protein [Acuticoccus sp. MNP-M23]WMS41040.1 hypothetical protein RDV64_13190 [Acuticoccus sp. MNP-M23]
MNTLRIALALTAVAALANPAAAQFRPLTPSSTGGGGDFGDTKLSYQNGVVYDDDLVPGRSGSQSFLASETNSAGVTAQINRDNTRARPNSPNLIGRDGRISTRR